MTEKLAYIIWVNDCPLTKWVDVKKDSTWNLVVLSVFRSIVNMMFIAIAKNEMIPKSELHIVTHVPRSAIRFVDVQGTTDQHLEGAFRKEIGLDVFPKVQTIFD